MMQHVTIMEDKRKLLLETYKEYVSHNTSESNKLLTRHSWDFLTSVKFGRFICLGSIFKEILAEVSTLGDEAPVVIQDIKTAFHSLERYAVNLWRFPWRKEYHKIKLYTGFFQLNVEQKLKNSKSVKSILNYLGYIDMASGDCFLREPVYPHQIINVALDLFLAQVDLEVIKEIIDNGNDGEFRLEWVVQVRQKTCDVKDAVDRLRYKLAKRQKLDQVALKEHTELKETNVTKSSSETQRRVRDSSGVRSIEGNGYREPKYPPVASDNSDVKPDDYSAYSGLGKSFAPSSITAAYEERNQHQACLAGLQNIPAYPLLDSLSSRIAPLDQFKDNEIYGVPHQGSQVADAAYYTPARDEMRKTDQLVLPSVKGGEKIRTAAARLTSNYGRDHRSLYSSTSYENVGGPADVAAITKYHPTGAGWVRKAMSTEIPDHTITSQSHVNLIDADLAVKTTDQTTRYFDVQRMVQGDDSATRQTRHGRLSNAQSREVSHDYPLKSHFDAARRNSPADSGVVQKETKFQEIHETGDPGKSGRGIPPKSGTLTEFYPSGELQNNREVNGRSEAPFKVTVSPQMTAMKHIVTECKEGMLDDEKSKLPLPESSDLSCRQVNPNMSERGNLKHSTKTDVDSLNTNLCSRLNLDSNEIEGRSTPRRNCSRSPERRRRADEKSLKDKRQTARAAVGNTDLHFKAAELSPLSSRECSAYPLDCRRHTGEHNRGSTYDQHCSSEVRNTLSHMSQKPFSPDLRGTAHEDVTPSEGYQRDKHTEVQHSGRSSRTDNTAEFGKSVQDPSVPGPSQSKMSLPRTTFAQCDFCKQQASNICQNCNSRSCNNCIDVLKADLCGQTKKSHTFIELNGKRGSSGRLVATTSPLDPRNVSTTNNSRDDVAKVELTEDWSCKRCTFLNPPDNRICAMCATSRDIKDPDLPEPGSRVCKHCTFYNKEKAKVCVTCGKTLDLTTSETVI